MPVVAGSVRLVNMAPRAYPDNLDYSRMAVVSIRLINMRL